MTEIGTSMLESVRAGLSIAEAIIEAGIDSNTYYRNLPNGERIILSTERAKYRAENKNRECQLTTSALPKETKISFVLLAKANRKTPATFLASLVNKALREARNPT